MHSGLRAVRADSRQTALVLIKFADALDRSGREDAAATPYQLAAQIAKASGLTDRESIAVRRFAPSSTHQNLAFMRMTDGSVQRALLSVVGDGGERAHMPSPRPIASRA